MATALQMLVKIGADPSGLQRELASAEKGLKAWSGRLTGLGSKMTLGVTAPILAIGGAAAKMAMDAVESENLFDVSFGNMAKSARAWSTQLRDQLGLNEYELRKNAGTFYVMFDSMGIGKQAALGMSEGLTKLAFDMASFHNLKPEEAFLKLRAGIVGETEPLKQLGVLVDENTVKHYALKTGLIQQGEQMTANQKVMARFGAIMEQTTKAQGDLARTADSPTNKLRMMREQVTQLTIDFGKSLMPAVQGIIGVASSLTPYLQSAVAWFDKLSPTTKNVVAGVLLAVAAIGPLLVVFGTLASAVSAMIGLGGTLAGIFGRVAISAGSAGAATAGAAGATGVAGAAAGAAIPPVSGLSVAMGMLGKAVAVVSAAFIGWEIGKKIDEWTHASDVVTKYTIKLTNWWNGVKDVSDADIDMALKARRMSEATQDSTKALDMKAEAAAQTAAVMDQLKSAFDQASAGSKKLGTEAKKAENELKKLVADLSGGKEFADAALWAKAVKQAGGVTKLTREETERLNDTLDRAIQKYRALGRAIPADVFERYAEAQEQLLTLSARDGLAGLPWQGPGTFLQSNRDFAGFTEASSVTSTYSDWRTQLSDALKVEAQDNIEAVSGAMRDAFQYLAGALSPAMASVLGGVQSWLQGWTKQLQQRIANGETLTGAGAWMAKNGNKVAGGIGIGMQAFGGGYSMGSSGGYAKGALGGMASGALTGAAMGSVIPGIGTAVGGIIGGAAGLVGGLLGGKKKAAEDKAARAQLQTDLVKTFGGMEQLRKAAQQVGFNLDAAFRVQKPQEFQKQIDTLTEKLATQKKQIEAVGQAIDAVNARSEAFAAPFRAAIEKLGDGATADAMKDAVADLARGAQPEFERLGVYATAAFAEGIRKHQGVGAIFAALQPTFDVLRAGVDQYGLGSTATIDKLLGMQASASQFSGQFAVLDALGGMVSAFSEAGGMGGALFQTIGADVGAQFRKMQENGGDQLQLMAMQQPLLQKLWEAQRQYGAISDEQTRELIRQAESQGIVGANMVTTEEKILGVLTDIKSLFARANGIPLVEAGVSVPALDLEDPERVGAAAFAAEAADQTIVFKLDSRTLAKRTVRQQPGVLEVYGL